MTYKELQSANKKLAKLAEEITAVKARLKAIEKALRKK